MGYFRGTISAIKEKFMPTGKYFKKEWIIIKEISKSGIEKLIKAGFLKNTNGGFVDSKKRQPIGVVKTVHGRHYYIEDCYFDIANKLK